MYCQEYSVNGQMGITIYSGGGDTGENTKYAFSVEVKADNYKIQIWIPGKETNYSEYAFNGSNMYVLHHLMTFKSLPGFSFTNNPLMFPASVEDRNIPPNDGWGAQYVWFAYASQSYFSQFTNRNNVMLPIWSPEDPRLRKQPFDMPIFYSLFPQTMGLPNDVTFINDGYYRSYNPATKSLDVIQLTPPFDKGFTNAYYRVLAATNIGNCQVPLDYVFVVCSTPFGKELPFERFTIEGRATSISNSAPHASTLPAFAGIASVADYRVHGTVTYQGTNVSYAYAPTPITNGQWIAPTQLELLRKKIESRVEAQTRFRDEQSHRASGQMQRRRIIIFAALILTIVFPPLILWRVMRRGQPKQIKK
jgi:hypothetical protein